MKSFGEVCEDTKEKLGRQLQEKEKVFLQWMYNRYQDEEEKDKNVNDVYAERRREEKLQCSEGLHTYDTVSNIAREK